jgi:nucleoside phosphorylase/tetratricopeptide (TPR) repeat protein
MGNSRAELAKSLTDGEAPLWPEVDEAPIPSIEVRFTFDEPFDVLLLVATQVERDAVLRLMTPWPPASAIARTARGAQTYYTGMLGYARVALTMCKAGSVGRDAATVVLMEAMPLISPRCVVAVGMAFGGYTKKQKIGDVLVSSRVIPYGPGRIEDGRWIRRGGEHDAGALLLNRLREASEWAFQRPDGYRCQIREGALLSGEKLVDSLEFKTELFEEYPEAIGGEMEGSGVVSAAPRQHVHEWIVVKGICDWGDGTKHKRYQPVAAAAAASLLHHVFSVPGSLDDLPRLTTRSDVARPAVSAPNAEITALQDKVKVLLQKDDLPASRAAIDDLRKTRWSQMDNSQKARLLVQSGVQRFRSRDLRGAATDFVKAHELEPENENYRAYRCHALLFRDEVALAHTEAKALLGDYPNNAVARDVYIRTLPAEGDVEAAVNEATTIEPTIAVAASSRLRERDPDKAAEILKRVVDAAPNERDYWTELGWVLGLQILRLREAGKVPPAQMNVEACDALQKAFAAMEAPPHEPVRRSHIALMISDLELDLGNTSASQTWLERGYVIAPNDPVAAAKKANRAFSQQEYSHAISILEPVLRAKDCPVDCKHLYATVLLAQATDESEKAAVAILDAITLDAAASEKQKWRAASEIVDNQIERHPTAASAVIDSYATYLGRYHTIRAKLVMATRTDDLTQAQALARELLAELPMFTTGEALDLGCLLRRLELYPECVLVLESRAPRGELAESTRMLVEAAMRCSRLDLVATVCTSLRHAGVTHWQVVDAEAFVRSQRGELTAALALTTEWLAAHPDDKMIRLRQALVAMKLGQTDLLLGSIDEVPTPNEQQPEIAVAIVELLRAAKRFDEGREFAYKNFKRLRHTESAWHAVLEAGRPDNEREALSIEADEAEPAPLLRAGPGTCVQFVEHGDVTWVWLERSDELVKNEDECGPTHPLAVALFGKRAGDEVVLGKAMHGLSPRRAKIVTVVDSFSRLFHRCMQSFELRFPETTAIHSFELPEDPDAMVKALIENLSARKQSVDSIFQAYHNGNAQLPQRSLAELCGVSVFDVIPHLVANGLDVRAAPDIEIEDAARRVAASREVIVDASAVVTACLLDVHGRIASLVGRVWIATATLDDYRVFYRKRVDERGVTRLGVDGQGLRMFRNDDATADRQITAVADALASLEQWTAFDEPNHQPFSSSTWDEWVSILGIGTTESIQRARTLGTILWTDDATVACLAAREGVSTISTQGLFEALRVMGAVSKNELAEIGAKLVGWRYVQSRVSPDLFAAAARLAKWEPGEWPLARHLEHLAIEPWEPSFILPLVADFLYRMSRENADIAALERVAIATTRQVRKRKDGLALTQALPRIVRLRFGVNNAVGAALASALLAVEYE